MGGLFSKKEKSRITDQDRAILGLKKQRDQLKQYQRRIEGVLEKVNIISLFLLHAPTVYFRTENLPESY